MANPTAIAIIRQNKLISNQNTTSQLEFEVKLNKIFQTTKYHFKYESIILLNP